MGRARIVSGGDVTAKGMEMGSGKGARNVEMTVVVSPKGPQSMADRGI